MQVLARELASIVAEVAVLASMAVASEEELAHVLVQVN